MHPGEFENKKKRNDELFVQQPTTKSEKINLNAY